jgi:putative endonuclease
MVGDRLYFVYLMASGHYGTFYSGVTNDLMGRVYEHRNDLIDGFTKRHGIHSLVWFEHHRDINIAIRREKLIKRWRRDWKITLLEEHNPHWEDLYPKLLKAGWRSNRRS